jgi:hypothetical protein
MFVAIEHVSGHDTNAVCSYKHHHTPYTIQTQHNAMQCNNINVLLKFKIFGEETDIQQYILWGYIYGTTNKSQFDSTLLVSSEDPLCTHAIMRNSPCW